MTSANAFLTSCGPGQDFSLQFTCTGPSCASLSGLPGVTCVTDAGSGAISCTNGVICGGSTNFTSELTFTQSKQIVSQTQKISLKDFCEEIDVVSDGTTGGTSAKEIDIVPCKASVSSSTTRSTSTTSAASKTTTTSHTKPSTTTTSHKKTSTTKSKGKETYSAYHDHYDQSLSHKGGHSHTSIHHHTTTTHHKADPQHTDHSHHTEKSVHTSKHSSSHTSSHHTSSHHTSTHHTSTHHTSTHHTSGPHHQTYNPYDHAESYHKRKEDAASSTGSVNPTVNLESSPTSSAITASTKSSKASSFQQPSRPAIWCVILLLFTMMVQGAVATSYQPAGEIQLLKRDLSLDSPAVIDSHMQLAERKLTPGWKTFSDLFSEYLAGKIDKPGLAENLVAELKDAVCEHAVGVLINKALAVDLVDVCVTALYTGNAIVAPEFEFLAVFGASITCNLLVSEALPGIGDLTSAICDEPKPCSEDLLTDPKNCGSCGNVCSTGVCANGACTSNTCTGQTCSTFGPCGPGSSCVCTSTSEGTGYCADGSTPCAGLAACTDSTECGSGEICAVGTCCGGNVCIGATFCGDTSPAAAIKAMFTRSWENATIASLGVWVD